MKILFISDNFPPESNAPAVRTWEHVRRWAKAGNQVTVITGAPNFPEGQVYQGYRNTWRTVDNLEGVRVVRVKTYINANTGTVRRIVDYVSFMVSAATFSIFEARPDLVVATSPQFFSAVAGYLVSRAKRVPFVFEVRDLWPASIVAVDAMNRSWALDQLERLELFLYRQAKAIVVVTKSFKEDLVSRGVDPTKISVVLNGVDHQTPRVARSESLEEELGLSNKFVVAYIGTHGMAHSLDTVVEAAKKLEDNPSIAFLFVGSGAAREALEKRVKDLGLANVRMLPRVPRERLPEIWSICDLGLIPLRNNPVFSTVIPSKLFELSSQEIPILMALPNGEATDMLREADAGEVVSPEDSDKMAEAIQRIAGSPELRRRYSAQGGAFAKRFSRDELAATMLQVLENAIQ